jgi:hypothetical protein
MSRFEDLTIATTAHNNAKMSADMLQSFEAHVGQVKEIVVVDDHSNTPLTSPVCLSPVRLIRTESALGFCKASDLALRAVQTEYALLVDADVLFQPGDFAGGFAEFRKRSWAWVNFQQVSFEGVKQASYEQPLMPPWVFAAGNQFFSRWQRLHQAPEPGANGGRIVPVIAAIGTSPNPIIAKSTQDIKFDRHGCAVVSENSLMTTRPGVFAGGDLVSGAATVILAMGAGKQAAAEIDDYLKNQN